jgi:hypothetical protein
MNRFSEGRVPNLTAFNFQKIKFIKLKIIFQSIETDSTGYPDET